MTLEAEVSTAPVQLSPSPGLALQAHVASWSWDSGTRMSGPLDPAFGTLLLRLEPRGAQSPPSRLTDDRDRTLLPAPSISSQCPDLFVCPCGHTSSEADVVEISMQGSGPCSGISHLLRLAAAVESSTSVSVTSALNPSPVHRTPLQLCSECSCSLCVESSPLPLSLPPNHSIEIFR